MYRNEVQSYCRVCGLQSTVRGFCDKHYRQRLKWGSIVVQRKTALEKYLLRKLRYIIMRCSDSRVHKYKYYGGNGIECRLTIEDLLFLWNRDRADQMKSPSVDRIDNGNNYTRDNCRFVEFSENRARRWAEALTKNCLECRTSFRSMSTSKRTVCRSCFQKNRALARLCRNCKNPFSGKQGCRYCDDCRNFSRLCAWCGSMLTRTRRFLKYEKWFCSRTCRGRASRKS